MTVRAERSITPGRTEVPEGGDVSRSRTPLAHSDQSVGGALIAFLVVRGLDFCGGEKEGWNLLDICSVEVDICSWR